MLGGEIKDKDKSENLYIRESELKDKDKSENLNNRESESKDKDKSENLNNRESELEDKDKAGKPTWTKGRAQYFQHFLQAAQHLFAPT